MKYLTDNKDSHVTVNQIADYLSSAGNHVGVTTIYRHLDRLVEQGLVRKYTVDGSTGACFQYEQNNDSCREHFHLKCEKCGCLIHLECSHLDRIYNHIYESHGFRINAFRTVFYGICKECAEKESKK